MDDATLGRMMRRALREHGISCLVLPLLVGVLGACVSLLLPLPSQGHCVIRCGQAAWGDERGTVVQPLETAESVASLVSSEGFQLQVLSGHPSHIEALRDERISIRGEVLGGDTFVEIRVTAKDKTDVMNLLDLLKTSVLRRHEALGERMKGGNGSEDGSGSRVRIIQSSVEVPPQESLPDDSRAWWRVGLFAAALAFVAVGTLKFVMGGGAGSGS